MLITPFRYRFCTNTGRPNSVWCSCVDFMQFFYLDGTPYAQFDYRNGLYYMDDVDKQHRSSLSLAHKDTLRIYAHKSTQRFIACVCVMYDMVWVWTINEGMVHSRDISSSAMLPASVLPSSSHKVANSHHLLGTRTIHQQTTTKKRHFRTAATNIYLHFTSTSTPCKLFYSSSVACAFSLI